MARPVRAPWPYDIFINHRGYLLGSPDQRSGATLVATKPADLAQQAPNELGYDAQPPTIAQTQSYDNLSGGFGQEIQLRPHDNRYHFALNVDYSGGTFGVKGPRLTTQTFNSVGTPSTDVTSFFELDDVLFATNGHWVQKRLSDSATGWDGVLDLGSGIATSAKVFYTNAGGGQNLCYLALGTSDFIWKFDGTSGTKHGTLYAQDFALTGTELWRAVLPNELSKCDIDADPWTAGNWTALSSYFVGDKQYNIARLATTINGTLLSLKTDGVYSLSSDGNSEDLYPHLHFATSDTNGVYGNWLNDLYLTYGAGAYRITPTPVLGSSTPHLPLTQIGPERVVDNTSVVKGRITAYAGHDSFCLYAALYNEDTGDSYLLKFGQWIEGPDGQPARAEVWHGSITKAFVHKKITAMHVSTIGAATDHKRLYLGFSDSTFAWFALPCTPNPVNCTEYLFSEDDGTIRLPWAHLMYRNDVKVLRNVTVSGMNLSDTDYAQVQVSAAPNVAFAYLVDGNENPVSFKTTPLQTIPVGADSLALQGGALGTLERYSLAQLEAYTLAELETLEGARASYSGRYLGLDVTLKTGDGGTSPRIIGMGFSYQVRLPLNLIHTYYVLAEQGLTRRDGTPWLATANDVRSQIRAAAEQSVPVPVTLPNETSTNHSVTGYSETTIWSERLHGWHGGIAIQAVEHVAPPQVATPIYGTLRRMEQYTLAELESFTLGQLETI